MGQMLRKFHQEQAEVGQRKDSLIKKRTPPDLGSLPPEVSLLVLSYLNATDLCLAGCVWKDLADTDLLWHGLCRSQWRFATIYRRHGEPGFSYRKVYLQLDEATLTFNADTHLGMEYLFKHELVENSTDEIAKFFHGAKHIDTKQKRTYLQTRPEVIDRLVELQNYENQFLPNALRKFFNETSPPNERNDYLSMLVDRFSQRFCDCNPQLGFSKDTVYVVCFSLIMLSVDLTSPHVKNKMSKREFIRNTRQAARGVTDDLAGHLYDNVYLVGHVAPQA